MRLSEDESSEDAADRQAFLDRMIAKRGYVLAYHRGLVANDLQFMRRAEALIEEVYLKQRHLDRKTKELVFVVAFTLMRASRDQIGIHVRKAIEAGASREEVLEVIEIAFLEPGVVIFQEAFEAWMEVTGAPRVDPSTASAS